MQNSNPILHLSNELPSHYADRLGTYYTSLVNQEHKKENGQFFTPVEIAELMGSFVDFNKESVRILDPGSGTAILSCALIEHFAGDKNIFKKIELVIYETDKEIIPLLQKSVEYLKEWLHGKNISLNYSINTNDFVLENAHCLSDNVNLFSVTVESFDIIISNPPYFKLPIDDKRVQAAKAVVNGHPNIYSLFMAISARLLKDNGQLVFITPRSYASGGYFKVFREYFFKIFEIDKVHLFVSRKDAFNRNKVLQETIIIKGTRKQKTNPAHQVFVSSSQGLKDIKTPEIKAFQLKQLIDLTSNEKILFLPTNDFEESIINIFKNWSESPSGSTLNTYNIQISTGPVVAFRARNFIQDTFENGTVFLAPLFWLHNVKQMTLEWPVTKPNKGQYIRIRDESRGIASKIKCNAKRSYIQRDKSKSLLIPNQNYVLVVRSNSKEGKNRLIAAPYFVGFSLAEYIGVEKNVKYLYRPDGHLDRNEVLGLCALLNSTLFDYFFRIFNGNVNVSATELREMPLPPLETIKKIGNSIILSNDFTVDNTNKTVIEEFNLKAISKSNLIRP